MCRSCGKLGDVVEMMDVVCKIFRADEQISEAQHIAASGDDRVNVTR
jgi:hypothetical protein